MTFIRIFGCIYKGAKEDKSTWVLLEDELILF